MPLYAFHCEGCGRDDEVFQHFTEPPSPPPLTHACECGATMARDLRSELRSISAHTFKPFESVAMGCPAWEAQEAYVNDQGLTVRKREDGSEKLLCPKGQKMNPKTGNIVVSGTAQMKELHGRAGLTPNQ